MPEFKGFGKPPEVSHSLLKDLKRKVSSAELQPSIEISFKWVQSLKPKQLDRLYNLCRHKKLEPDLVATVIYLAALEQGLEKIRFTEAEVENVDLYLERLQLLIDVIASVEEGMMEVINFPVIHRKEKFGYRITPKGEEIAKYMEAKQ